jgi:flavorubredoxin
LAGGFGSFGWSGESRDMIRTNLENLKLKYVGEGMFVKFTPADQDQDAAMEYGKQIGRELLALNEDE